ncbi:hypothetical protein ACFLZ8_05545 [Planctomycetota bacterium]
MEKVKWSLSKELLVVLVLCTIVYVPFCQANMLGEIPDVEHHKMLSTVEYTGQGQFKHQVETQLTVKKERLSDNRTQYFISSQDFNLDQNSSTTSGLSSNELSFMIDDNKRITTSGRDLTLLEKVNNYCVQSLQQVSKQDIGKTWKQSFDLSTFDYSLPKKITFTLTAMNIDTETYGQMIAVRALSEPFVVKAIRAQEGVKDIKSKIRVAYLFDSQIDNVYLSVSVYEASANVVSSNERLRHEVATYKTNAGGVSVDLSGLGSDFEKFIRKVGLTNKNLTVSKEVAIPLWAQYEGLRASQVTNMCAATACEGALNPVTTLCFPVARTIALQSMNRISSAGEIGTIGSILAKSVPAMGGMKIAVAPAWVGLGLSTAQIAGIAGATAGGIAIAENSSSDSSSTRSPSTP